jgi:hypothetical protein
MRRLAATRPMRRPQCRNKTIGKRSAQLPMQTLRCSGSLAEEQLNRVEVSRQTLISVLSDPGIDHRRTTPFHDS